MRSRSLLVLVVMVLPVPLMTLAAPGCGTTIETVPGDSGTGGAANRDGGTTVTTGSYPYFDGAVPDVFPDYTDPGCPDAGPPKMKYACDPYHQFNGDCAMGQGCFIEVTYPTHPCGEETYGSYCGPSGPGMQGDPCTGGPNDCGAGFVCVVTGSGNQCVQLCPLQGNDGCPEGLVCEPIDVEGFGGCL